MTYFKVRDLMINVIDERLKPKKGEMSLCSQDQPTQILCGHLSPVMLGAKLSPRVERLAEMAKDVLKGGDHAGLSAIKDVAAHLGLELVGGALGGKAGIPDPNCTGTSELPPTISPIGLYGQLLEVSDLAGIKARMLEAITAIDAMEIKYAPRGGVESEVAYDHLNKAAESLKSR